MTDDAIRAAIAAAVRETLKAIGLEQFKKTSFFVSNVVASKAETKQAA